VTQSGEPLPPPATARPVTIGNPAQPTETVAAVPLLSVRGLVKHFPLQRDGFFGRKKVVRAVDGVDLDVAAGETVGVVGESGCGKSTFARLVVRIHAPTAGSIRFAGQEIAEESAATIRPLRRRMQMVFQDPYASLNPAHDRRRNPKRADPLSRPRHHGAGNVRACRGIAVCRRPQPADEPALSA
jgi:peptide/nickel transport system ATP-binding protein